MSVNANVHVLDDNAEHLEALGFLLKSRNFNVKLHSETVTFLNEDFSHFPSCAVIDFNLGSEDGIQIASMVKSKYAYLPMAIISAFGNVPAAVSAMKYGLSDFLEKPFDNEKFIETVDKMSITALSKFPEFTFYQENLPGYQTLTKRESEVFHLIATGHTNVSASGILKLSSRTVEQHRAIILKKMKIRDLSEIIRFYKIHKDMEK